MRDLFLLLSILLACCSNGISQIYIDHVDNPCPSSDILTVCLGDNTSYVGQYEYRTYDHFCGDEIRGVLRIYRNVLGEYFIDDFSFGTWPQCFNIDPPSGTLRLNIDCNEVLGISGTDNYGDVWGSDEVIYTGNSLIISWFNSFPEFGTTELTPLDGRDILEPLSFLDSSYSFEWSTGDTTPSILIDNPGRYSVTVTDSMGVRQNTFMDIAQDESNFEPECSGEILDLSYFLDNNKNGIQDNGEKNINPGEKYIQFFPPENYFAFEGPYDERYVLSAQSYDIELVNPDFGSTQLPMEINMLPDQDVQALKLGLYPVNETETAKIDISSASIERCNSTVAFHIRIRNTGTTKFKEPVQISFDPVLEYVNAVPEPEVVNDGQLSWNIVVDDHSQEELIKLYLKMPSVDFLGNEFCLDPYLGANEKTSDAFCFELSCAYDPNDKHGTPFRGDRNLTLFEEEIKYTIRFENLGNDTAFNVRVEDRISDLFDINSFRFIQSSHELSRHFIDQNRKLVFLFNNILLPSIEQDSLANKGFVQFALKPLVTLPEESQVSNTASIYFDLNDAVITNTTSHTMVSELESNHTDLLDFDGLNLTIYPNPAQDLLNVRTDEQDLNNYNYRIYDVSGKLLLQGILTRGLIDLSALDAGMYLLQLSTEEKASELIRFARY